MKTAAKEVRERERKKERKETKTKTPKKALNSSAFHVAYYAIAFVVRY